jgi:hypothetical protein
MEGQIIVVALQAVAQLVFKVLLVLQIFSTVVLAQAIKDNQAAVAVLEQEPQIMEIQQLQVLELLGLI